MVGRIYKVTNKITSEVYIGQTTNTVRYRWHAHVGYAMRKEKLCAFHKAIKKYGKKNFEVVEIVSIESSSKLELKLKLDLLEVSYIHHYNSCKQGYNSTFGGGSGPLCHKVGKETRKKQSKIRKHKRYKFLDKENGCFIYTCATTDNESPFYYPIAQYDLQGNLIKVWDNITSISDINNFDRSTISRACKRKGSAYGYQWRKLDKGTKAESTVKAHHNTHCKEILQYDLDGNLIREWDSASEAAKVLGACRASIQKAAAGKQKQSFNYIWKYKNK